VAIFLLPAMVLLASPSAFAKRKAATKASGKDKTNDESLSTASSSTASSGPGSEGYKYETPSPGSSADSPPSQPVVAQSERAATALGVADAPAPDAIPPAAEKAEIPPAAQSVPRAEEEPPAVAGPQPVYVEHLGPTAYPGKLRGLYGGSMWLEPSFNGLQWPYMPRSGVGISGSVWVDSGYEKITRDYPSLPNTSMWVQQSRAVLRVTPTYASGDFFIQGQVELVGNGCQSTNTVCTTAGTFTTDDLWIRVGQWNVWDLKAGRFEAWELYHTGMGLDVNTLERQGAFMGAASPSPRLTAAPTFYGVNYLHDRPADGLGVGYIALHAYPTNYLRFEMLGELGTTDTASTGYNEVGGRPSAILDFGLFKLKAGAEYDKRTFSTQEINASTQSGGAQTKGDQPYYRTRKGFGGSAQLVIDPIIELGGSFGMGKVFETQPANSNASGTGSYTTISVGGFINVRPAKLWLLGIGANWTTQNDSFYASGATTPDYSAHLQGFLALQYLLARQLFIKAVFGYARADFQDTDVSIPIWSNYMYSARVRLMYLY
jgi:hypothetical protein